jgi:TIR domain
MPTHPKVFISYSWDDEAHKEWVKELAIQLRADGVDARLDHWHAVPGDQLPRFMGREIQDNDYVLIVCTPKYKEKSDKHIGGVGYEGDIMTGEVFTKQNDKKFIPVLARGSWTEASPSWLVGSRYIDLSDAARYAAGYDELNKTLPGMREQAPPLGPLPKGFKPPARSQSAERVRSNAQHIDLELFDRRLAIHDAAMRLIEHVVAKGTCTKEELDRFANATKNARYLLNADTESYLRKLSHEAFLVRLGQQSRKA